ncbi:MAG: CoA pyrophosphatase [Nitratireductor sp.]|nr:CoA pyrophosphatase [Nitratireductor sp.]
MLETQPRPDFTRFAAGDLRMLARQRLPAGIGETHGDHVHSPGYADWVISRAVKPAAVLVPFAERPGGINIILTKRLDNLRSHSGQVAFPGGKIDPEDVSPEAAALREAHEEIALEPSQVEVIGRLPDYLSGSGYRIAPVLGLVAPAASFIANPQEVDYVFEVPLAFLMDPANHRRGSRMFQGAERQFIEMPYGEHYIWGVTAGILRLLHDRLFA